MAITQISQVKVRRGLNQDLPQLASGEMGWSLDTRQLYIGNGTLAEGAPEIGVTEILTEYSDILSLADSYTFKGLASGGIIQTGIDAAHPIVRTLQDKLDDIVSVKDFGAIGDGVADDTAAIQRAMDRVYGTAQNVLLTYHHRTIYFPAGQYRITSTLSVPPTTKLQGEGKRTTIITGSFAGPLLQFKDQFGQTGISYGASNSAGVLPDVNEYHFSDIQFWQQVPTLDQSCLVIDGCTSSTFTRVMFRGISSVAGPSTVLYNVDRGAGVAGVALRNLSDNIAIRNVVFDQCDFWQINYGAEINNSCRGLTFNDCYFDELYHYITIANNITPDSYGDYYYPQGITISNNYMRYSAAEGVKVGENVSDVISSGNFFTGWGLQDYQSDSPIENPDGIAAYPALSFSSPNNFSIGDSFENDTVNPLVPLIVDNGYNNYYILQGNAVVNGRRVDGQGQTITLANATSFTSAGIVSVPSYPSNLEVNYALTHANSQRTGQLIVSNFGNTYVYSEEYTESGLTNVTFRANPTTGDIEYVSTATGAPAVLTYNIKYFNQ